MRHMLNLQIWLNNAWLKTAYPVQDQTWPSRRWNRTHTDYADLSGYSL